MTDEQQSTALIIPEDATVKVVQADQLPDFDSMEEGMSLAPSYREFQQGVPVRAIFCGFSEMQSQNRTGHEEDDPKMIPLGVFQSTDGVWVHAGANLVQQVRNVPIGTPLQVTYKGKERTKRGNDVAVFDVRLLKQSDPNTPTASANTIESAQGPATQQQSQSAQTASPTGDKASQQDVVKVMRKATEKGVQPLEFANNVLGRTLARIADLTTAEATSVMSYLEQL